MKTTSSLRIVIFYGLCLALTLTASCSVLHPTQLTAVESVCERVDTLSFLPQRVLQMIANNRQERNLYFTATLITPQLRVAQLNDMVDFQIKEEKMIKRYLSYSDVLRSYFLALKRLCAPTRYEQYGVELRGVGRSLDSLIHYYNELEGEQVLPEGYAKLSGKVLGFGAEAYVRRKQAVYVRDYVQLADTLVGMYCDSLAVMIAGPRLKEWIEHEKVELATEYALYLQLCTPLSGREEDRFYLEKRRQLKDCETLLRKGKTALTSLKKAHHKLALSLKKRCAIDQIYPEILEFNKLIHQLVEVF